MSMFDHLITLFWLPLDFFVEMLPHFSYLRNVILGAVLFFSIFLIPYLKLHKYDNNKLLYTKIIQ